MPSGQNTMEGPAGRKSLGIVLLACLLLRLAHLASAVNSPFTYHLGPDEEYYLQFGLWLSGLAPGSAVQFAFMDPAYGYLTGMVFKLLGHQPMAILLIQALVDTVSCALIYLVARELGHARAGLIAAALYALTATAIMYSATFLKATWVASAIMIWCWAGLLVSRSEARWPWLLFGLLCGLLVSLRGNLLLLALLSLFLLPWIHRNGRTGRGSAMRFSLLLAGLMVPLALLSMRNVEISGKVSPLPNNGGTVLHQVYNPDNPRAESWYPEFAPYTNPVDIQRGYTVEAERIAGRALSASEVDAYWRSEAIAYIADHPGQAGLALSRKALEFASTREVANNRALREEKMFSPVLKWLPAPFGLLLVLGLPGLALLGLQDRRGWWLLAPLAVVLATFAVFFAEARFRFHAVPVLALGAGLFIDRILAWIADRRRKNVAMACLAVVLLSGVSVFATRLTPVSTISWESIAWGYIKMGDISSAARILATAPADEAGGAKWEEARGFIAWQGNDLQSAITHYSRAVEINNGSHVAHYNLALLYRDTGQAGQARHHAELAWRLAALPEYRQLLVSLPAN